MGEFKRYIGEKWKILFLDNYFIRKDTLSILIFWIFLGIVSLSNIHSIIIVFLKKWVFEHVVRQKGKVVIV